MNHKSITPCSVDGCEKPAHARGWCQGHYKRWKKYGDLTFMRWESVTPEMRFLAKVDKNGPIPTHRPELGPCWTWIGRINGDGYGGLYFRGRQRAAHIFAFEHYVGAIPEGTELDHLCRNPSCVNPGHLEAVTHTENLRRGNGWSGRNHRKTHCPKGHEYTPENTRLRILRNGSVSRNCRACNRERNSKRDRRKVCL